MSDNKQPKIGLFLGAGASVPFGKPTTKKLREGLAKEYKKLLDVLIKKYSGRANPQPQDLWYSILLHSILSFPEFEDIEHVLQALKEIDDFFIKSQHGGRYVQSLILGSYADKYSPDSVQDWRFSEYVKTIEEQRKRIEKHIFDIYLWDQSKDKELGQIYDQLLGEIKKSSKDIHIATTNYDRAIEVYCSKQERKCRCVYGFRYDEYGERRLWDKEKGFDIPSVKEGVTNVYLYKLHGSLNWKKHATDGIVAISEESLVSDPNYTKDMVVFPTLSPKEGKEIDPYKTIRKKFKEELVKRTDVCIAIGFSFRDEHISNIFADFLKRGRRTLIVVSPSADEDICKNLLAKKLPQTRWASSKEGKDIRLYDKKGTEIITINDPIDTDNATRIIRRIFSFSYQAG